MVNVDEDEAGRRGGEDWVEAGRRGGEGFRPGLGGPGQPIVVEARTEALLAACVTVIQEGFATVAADFGLTEQRVPTNPAYLTLNRLRAAQLRGDRILALVVAGRVVGSVSLHTATITGVVDLERLAVAPPWRHHGYGALLLDHSYPLAAAGGGNAVRVGIIAANTLLRGWYEYHGFTVTETRTFEHLPFTVCYLQRSLLPAEPPPGSTIPAAEPGFEP